MARRPRRILFVCHANVCRSPLAEALFRAEVQRAGRDADFVIDSAGTHALEGAPPHPSSVEVGRERGAHVHGTARQLLRADLAGHDEVLVMDDHQRRFLASMLGPSAFGPVDGLLARIRAIRALTTGRSRGLPPDVDDPVGRPIEAYRACADVLETCARALLAEQVALLDGQGPDGSEP